MAAITISATSRPAVKAEAKQNAIKRTKPMRLSERSTRLALPVSLATGFVTLANKAQAHESMRMIETQVAQLSDVPTPLLYFGFLTSSLTFAAGTYIVLSKIKLI